MRKANQQPSTGTRSIFRKAIDHLLSASQLEQSKTLADVRQNLFELLTLIVFPVSTVPLLGGIYKSVQLDRWFVLALYILCYTILLVLFWARRRLAYVYRVSIALFLIYAFALFLLVRFGIPGAGIILFLTLCMVTSIFLGIRAGVATMLVCATSISVVGFGMSTGWIPFDTRIGLNSLSASSWFQGVTIYLMLAIVMIFSPGLVMRRLQTLLGSERKQSQKLKKSNQDLLNEIQARKEAEQMRDRLEEQVRQAQKMESVGRLAGGVAHDFNNLLTSITGNIALAQMDLHRSDPMYETLDEIQSAAQRAADLTRQLLAFSRKSIIKPKIVDLHERIENMQKMLERIIGEDVVIHVASGHPQGRIKADPGQIEQIIVNLSVNARDAMPDGGLLTIEVGEIQLGEDYCKMNPDAVPGEYITLSFADNGEGMDEETKKNIFDPFFTTKSEGEGTGLGLSTVYGIVKQHHGFIEVESETGKGTTFTIYFPLVRRKADPIRKSSILDDLPRGNETILIVEDETMVRNIATRILTRLGYNILSAENGLEALSQIEKYSGTIDLLLTDIIMPNMNGRELAQKVQEESRKVKILYTSGYSEDIIAQRGILEKGLQFLAKPYTPQTLALKVRHVFRWHVSGMMYHC